MLTQVLQAEKSGDIAGADALCDDALRQNPGYETLLAGARIARKLGNHAKACDRLAAAYMLQPSANLKFQLAVSHMDAGNLTAAEQLVRDGLAKKPRDFALVNAYGVILKRMERYDEAVEHFNRAAKIDAKSISPPVNLGNTFLLLDKPGKAAEQFLKATRMEPGNGENHRLLASAYGKSGDYAKALASLQQAMKRAPGNPRVVVDIAGVYLSLGEPETAMRHIDLGLEKIPDHPDLLRRKALVLRRLNQSDAAVALLEDLLKRRPTDVETWINLGIVYFRALHDLEKANGCFARALELNPRDTEAAALYCECLNRSRYASEAAHIDKAYEVALGLLDSKANVLKIADTVHGVFLRCADYASLARLGDRSRLMRHWVEKMNVGELHLQLGRVESMEDRLELVAMHLEWGKKAGELAARKPMDAKVRPAGGGKVRVGLMSSDLRNHPVSYFVLPLLQRYDRARFEVHCYSFYPKEPDRVQQEITGIVDGFRCLPDQSDESIARTIADDGIDILFELGGTTHLNKLQVCAFRPAPIQVSWLGYPHSSGLSCIDYILTDPYITPPHPGLLLEKPFELAESWVTLGELGFYDIPIEPGIPEDRNGRITFGTANNPYKYTPKVFETWAAIMRQVPDSRFLFIRPEGAARHFVNNVLDHFAAHGIEAGRILFAPVRGAHMPYYNQIDISLDPFPHVGGTTTCETLWMGVPVITLVGPAFFERLSYSNLCNAGLGEWCASDLASYIDKAVALARDREQRRHWRHNLRQQIRAHPLGQPERFTRNFENKTLEVLGKA